MRQLRTSQTTSESGSSKKQAKIEKLQELDWWRADMTKSVPIELANLACFGVHSDSCDIEVTESNGNKWIFTTSLKQIQKHADDMDLAFPIEAGKQGKHKRILPDLDLQKRIWRKHNDKEQIQKYLDALLKLPEYIRMCQLMVNFFLKGPQHISSIPSNSSVSHSSKASSIDERKYKIKVSHNGDLAMIHLKGPTITMDQVREQVKVKFAIKDCPDVFHYLDLEGETVTVIDDEDLQIGLSIMHSPLKLATSTI